MGWQRSRGWLPWVLVLIVGGVMLAVGLLSPWRLCLVEKERPETAALLDYLREQYMIGVSDSYAANRDLDRARERLTALGEEDPVSAVAELASRYIESDGDAEATRRLIALALALGAEDESMAEYLVATAPSPTPTETPIPTFTPTDTPAPTQTPTLVPTATNTPLPPAPPAPTPTRAPTYPTAVPREWDRRLDYFWPTVRTEEAQASSGQWYWRLVRAIWQEECGGRHHIYVEVLDEHGNRSFGQTVVIEYGGGAHPEPYPHPDKLGEEHAFNYPMNELLGAYNVYVDGDPSDKMYGLGLGTRADPYRKHHTCFLLTFRRTYQP
ncbi:MAG: hypothetical protein CEE40_06030 [Chloroflexi bacterium B3_Chlor]|nr:MAG: hypothetical protein CEE40_06030 [Chloroflexi bacterium B3_Chlor]